MPEPCTVSSAAKPSGTFTDVVYGPNGTNSRDTNFPQAYPTGTTGRGVLYTSLFSAEQAPVLDAIEAWTETQDDSIAQTLQTRYELAAQLAGTYVGYGIGQNGTASFPAQMSGTTQHCKEKVRLTLEESSSGACTVGDPASVKLKIFDAQ